jgi:hypothetical protein
MMRRPLVPARLLVRGLCTCAALTLLTASCGGDVEGTTSQAADRSPAARGQAFDPKTYALDEARVRKLAAVMSAWDPRGPEPTNQDPNVYVSPMARAMKGVEFENKVVKDLMSRNSTATIEGVPELKAAIAREGLSTREFAELFLSYKAAEGQLMVAGLSQLAGAVSGTPPPNAPQPAPKSPGVFEGNLELLRRMDKEGTLPPSWW